MTANTTIDETPVADEEEEKTRTYRVLRLDVNTSDELVTYWREEPTIDHIYIPSAADVGEMYGEGEYLLIDTDPRYSSYSTYPLRVVAERRYREASEDES